jgi:hypothetical protein
MNMPRRIMPQGMQRPPLRQPMQQGRPFPKDRELDATLKKIKEIGS